jgi:all-trans-retinol 13,14-reductase
MKKDVIVVGAGISGLLTALALSKEGRNVLVLERSSFVGGVCRSYEVDGYQVDTGPHIITRLEGGPLKELMQRYFDVVPNFVPHGKYFVRLNNKLRPFPWNLQGWFNFDVLPEIDRIHLITTLFSTSYRFNAGEDLSKKPIGELIGPGISPQTSRFLNCLSYFMTGAPMNETPVERFIDSQKYKSRSSNILEKLHNALMKEGAQDQCYPKGGIQSVTTAVVSSMPRDLVEIRTDEEVVKIHPEEKKIETTKGEYSYNVLVYAGFASDLPNIIDELSGDYRKSLSKLPKTNALTIWLGLNESAFKLQGSEIWVDSDPYFWAVPVSNYDSTLAPKGKQLVGFLSRLELDSEPGQKEKKKALEAIYKVMPELEKKTDLVHYQVLIPEKAAWTVNTEFASIRTPFKNLYLVGTDTEKRSMGLTRASYSVIKLLDALREDKVI